MKRAAIPLLALVVVACTSVPASAPIPIPTWTSRPYHTLYPTHTPYPTNTPPPAPTAQPTSMLQPTNTPRPTPMPRSTTAETPEPAGPLSPAPPVEELKLKWGVPFGSSALVAGICSELARTAEQSRAGGITEAEGQAAVMAATSVLDAVADSVARWTPSQGQESYKGVLERQIGQVRAVTAQWMNEKAPPVDASVSLGACAEAVQDTIWRITEAMIADGFSEDTIQEMVDESTAVLAESAEPGDDATAPTVAPESTAASTPGGELAGLEILGHQSYIRGQWFHIVGEVRNNANTPMGSVEVAATLYDNSGRVTGTGSTFTLLDVIPPGGKAPFDIGTDEWPGTADYKLQVQGQPDHLPRQDLVILSHDHYVDGGWFHVRGEVKNTGTTPAVFVRLIVTLHDAAGDVVALDFAFTRLVVVPPGGTSPFETGTDHWPGFDHYEIQVQGQ
jgi:hypothetical protein